MTTDYYYLNRVETAMTELQIVRELINTYKDGLKSFNAYEYNKRIDTEFMMLYEIISETKHLPQEFALFHRFGDSYHSLNHAIYILNNSLVNINQALYVDYNDYHYDSDS